MAIIDYRYDPFLDVINVRAITDEAHTVPESSPFTVRLNEVPYKSIPSTIVCQYEDGTILTEVAAQPSQGQFWPDYSVSYGEDWNTGTLLFNAADAGKKVLVSYNGMGALVDDRLPDMMELELTGSEQPERYLRTSGGIDGSWDESSTSGSGNTSTTYGYLYTHTGLGAGTYTLRSVIQKLVNLSHYQEYTKDVKSSNCNCECNCQCTDDGEG